MKIIINYEGDKMPLWEILSSIGFNAEEQVFEGKIWSENSRKRGSYTIEIEDINQEDVDWAKKSEKMQAVKEYQNDLMLYAGLKQDTMSEKSKIMYDAKVNLDNSEKYKKD